MAGAGGQSNGRRGWLMTEWGRAFLVLAVIVIVGAAVLAVWKSAPLSWDWQSIGEGAALTAAGLLVVLFFVTLGAAWSNFSAIVSAEGAMLVAVYESVWALLLSLMAIDYIRQAPVSVAPTIGSLPTPVLWFGALGGVMVSLAAVADRSADGSWNDHWAIWHLLRPMVGVAVGLIAVLIFQAGVLSIGASPQPSGGGNTNPQNLTYYLIAFVVAYRETTFRDLIKRLADTLFTTGTVKPVIDKVTPSHGLGGAVAITGSGLGKVKTVRIGARQADPESVGDGFVFVALPNRSTVLEPDPEPTKPAIVPVVVDGADGSCASTYTYDPIPAANTPPAPAAPKPETGNSTEQTGDPSPTDDKSKVGGQPEPGTDESNTGDSTVSGTESGT